MCSKKTFELETYVEICMTSQYKDITISLKDVILICKYFYKFYLGIKPDNQT